MIDDIIYESVSYIVEFDTTTSGSLFGIYFGEAIQPDPEIIVISSF